MKRFATVFFILFGVWWLFHPVANAKKPHNKNSSSQVIVYSKEKSSGILNLRKGKRLVVPVAKILDNKKKLPIGKLVKEYRYKLKAKKLIMLELHIDNKKKSVANKDVVAVRLVSISNLGKDYLRLEVKDSNGYLKTHGDKLSLNSVVFNA